MPLQSKRLRAAKWACQHAQAGFAAHAASPEGSVYLISGDGSNRSAMDLESVDGHSESDILGGNDVKTSVETLQCLYSTVLPPHLCLEENRHTKCQKMDKRKAVYTGDSRTTHW